MERGREETMHPVMERQIHLYLAGQLEETSPERAAWHRAEAAALEAQDQ